jgi:hypothetical protein
MAAMLNSLDCFAIRAIDDLGTGLGLCFAASPYRLHHQVRGQALCKRLRFIGQGVVPERLSSAVKASRTGLARSCPLELPVSPLEKAILQSKGLDV